jgi:hypothetical protein
LKAFLRLYDASGDSVIHCFFGGFFHAQQQSISNTAGGWQDSRLWLGQDFKSYPNRGTPGVKFGKRLSTAQMEDQPV